MKKTEMVVDGYFGKEKVYLVPIPENPPTIVDIFGYERLYLGDLDTEFVRVGSWDENHKVDIACTFYMPRNWFPELS